MDKVYIGANGIQYENSGEEDLEPIDITKEEVELMSLEDILEFIRENKEDIERIVDKGIN